MKIAIIGAGQVGGAFGRDTALNAPLSRQDANEFLNGKPLFVERITYFDINVAHLTQMKAIAGEVAALRGANVIDVVSSRREFRKVVNAADVVLTAVSGDQVGNVTAEFASDLKSGAIYSDTASVKVPVATDVRRELQAAERNDVEYIWIHQGTGTALTGPRATSPGVYRDAAVFIDELAPGASKKRQEAWHTMQWLLKTQGSQIEPMTAERQDQFFAVASGFHHVLAYTLMDMGRTLDGDIRPEYRFAGTSLRNITRIAASSPEMLAPLLLGHKENIVRTAASFREQMHALADPIRRQDAQTPEARLSEAHTIRLSLAPRDTVPRESIDGDIHDLRLLSAPGPSSFSRGVLLPYLVAYAETLNADAALSGIAFQRFPNPSFLDGSAPALNDPHRVAQLMTANSNELFPLIGPFMRRLEHNVSVIAANDRPALDSWISGTRPVRNKLMPPPRRAATAQDATPSNEAVRSEFFLNLDAGQRNLLVVPAAAQPEPKL